MTEPADRELAVDIETTLRAIPGVTGLFRTKSVVSQIIGTGAQVLGIEDAKVSLVRVERTSGGVCVEVAIGVDTSTSTVDTTHRAQAAIGALIASQGMISTEIHVTVVHIDDTPKRGASA